MIQHCQPCQTASDILFRVASAHSDSAHDFIIDFDRITAAKNDQPWRMHDPFSQRGFSGDQRIPFMRRKAESNGRICLIDRNADAQNRCGVHAFKTQQVSAVVNYGRIDVDAELLRSFEGRGNHPVSQFGSDAFLDLDSFQRSHPFDVYVCSSFNGLNAKITTRVSPAAQRVMLLPFFIGQHFSGTEPTLILSLQNLDFAHAASSAPAPYRYVDALFPTGSQQVFAFGTLERVVAQYDLEHVPLRPL